MGSKSELRILILIPNLGRGGAQQVYRDQLTFFSKHYNTIGCVFNWDDTFEDDRMPNMISLGIPAGKNVFSKVYFFIRRVFALSAIKKKYDINFSISHLEGADYVNLLSKRKDSVVCWIHGSKVFDKEIEGIIGTVRKNFFIPFTYRFADKVITVSEGIRQELINIFKVPLKKVKTIYNSFALDDIVSKAGQEVTPGIEALFLQQQVLITHCRLSRPKNLFALIDIYSFLKTDRNIPLIILGDGELRDKLLTYCKEKDLRVYTIWETTLRFTTDYDVYFLGYERNPYRFLSRATLYIMTSSWEGFPLALCEAMACGVPVLSSDCYTGPREIISPQLSAPQPIVQPIIAPYGILMPLAVQENIKVWADTILQLLNDDIQRQQLAESGKERVSAFDRKKISMQWLDLIDAGSIVTNGARQNERDF